MKNLPVIQPVPEIKDHGRDAASGRRDERNQAADAADHARSRRGIGHKSDGAQPDAHDNASQKHAHLDRDIHQGHGECADVAAGFPFSINDRIRKQRRDHGARNRVHHQGQCAHDGKAPGSSACKPCKEEQDRGTNEKHPIASPLSDSDSYPTGHEGAGKAADAGDQDEQGNKGGIVLHIREVIDRKRRYREQAGNVEGLGEDQTEQWRVFKNQSHDFPERLAPVSGGSVRFVIRVPAGRKPVDVKVAQYRRQSVDGNRQ